MRSTAQFLKAAAALITKYGLKATTSRARTVIDCIQLHTAGYVEPGYTTRKRLIALGDWNTITAWNEVTHTFDAVDTTPTELGKALEARCSTELEWEDEWVACNKCMRLMRTQPNGYGWKKCWVDLDGDRVCYDCISRSAELREAYFEYLEHHTTCMTLDLDPAKCDYVLLRDELERGLHEGQDADPKVITALLTQLGLKRFIYKLDAAAQFGSSFSVWGHRSHFMPKGYFDKASYAQFVGAFATQNINGSSPSEAMKQALQYACRLPEPVGASIVVTTLHQDGTASKRAVTPEDFVAGKALEE